MAPETPAHCRPIPQGKVRELRCSPHGGPARNRGAALIMSLVILLILTILGLTAMSTSSLEEKMSGNSQEGTRVFEVAESGLQQALFDSTQFLWGVMGTPKPYPSINGRTAEVKTDNMQEGSPPRGFGFSNDQPAYYFEQQSTVLAPGNGANATITQGVVHIK